MAKKNTELTFTNAQILEWKKKAEKWDTLDKGISRYYAEPEDDDYDEAFAETADSEGLIGIGELAATAFGYL